MSAASFTPRPRRSLDAELDLPALGAALWLKKWKILRPTILVALTTLLAVQVVTPRYLSESRVFIEGRDNCLFAAGCRQGQQRRQRRR